MRLCRIEEAMATEWPWVFLSPHLDDAVLSCGGLIAEAAQSREIWVVTVFSESGPAPYTRAARSFVRQCSAVDARTLFAERRKEDTKILSEIGVKSLHLGIPDALFRRRVRPRFSFGLWELLPQEMRHRYPTYRFDIARGRIAKGDGALNSELALTVGDVLSQTGARTLFCPVGVGNHVDHLIARAVAERFPESAVFYSDFPYNISAEPDENFLALNGLRAWTLDGYDAAVKQRLIQGYATQVPALFPAGTIPLQPEKYFVPA